ncbi:MAG: DUF3000 domain-containing protein [Actinomycetales bacterium]
MSVREIPTGVPLEFSHAVASVRSATVRSEVHLSEIPAPQRIAPYSLALSGEVETGDGEAATGRFVLLHDPDGQDAWQGTMRLVTYARASLEPEFATEPMLSDVGWAWLTDALSDAGAIPLALGGTVTRVLSDCHGVLADREPTVEIEVRASWTSSSCDIAAHLVGWSGLLCTVAGLPPLPEGVVSLRRPLR